MDMLIGWHARWKECGGAVVWQFHALSMGPTRPGAVISVGTTSGAIKQAIKLFYPSKSSTVIRSPVG